MRTKPGGAGHMSSVSSLCTSQVGKCKAMTLMTSDHTVFQVCRSGYCRAGIGRSVEEGLKARRADVRFIVSLCIFYICLFIS